LGYHPTNATHGVLPSHSQMSEIPEP
jgi:hypothetical protein